MNYQTAMKIAETKLNLQRLGRQAEETTRKVQTAKKTMEGRKGKGMATVQKAASKTKANFKVQTFEFVFFENDPIQNKTLERELNEKIGGAEICYMQRIGQTLLVITREQT